MKDERGLACLTDFPDSRKARKIDRLPSACAPRPGEGHFAPKLLAGKRLPASGLRAPDRKRIPLVRFIGRKKLPIDRVDYATGKCRVRAERLEAGLLSAFRPDQCGSRRPHPASRGLNVFGCGALIVGNILIGVLMDLSHSNYRMAFLWTAVISASAIFPMILVIRGWKKHGGHESCVAPLPR